MKLTAIAKDDLEIETPVYMSWTKSEEYEVIKTDTLIHLSCDGAAIKTYPMSCYDSLCEVFDFAEMRGNS